MAILRLVEMEKAVVEGAGAIGLAAVLGNYVPELKGKKYKLIVDRLIYVSYTLSVLSAVLALQYITQHRLMTVGQVMNSIN